MCYEDGGSLTFLNRVAQLRATVHSQGRGRLVDRVLRMHSFRTRFVLWVGRALLVATALWWPAVWRDPIYTSRQENPKEKEIRLPSGAMPATEEERAMAIFWAWEHRTLVKTRWIIGPYRGLRDGPRNAQGWWQTLCALTVVWLGCSMVGFRWASPDPVVREDSSRKKGVRAWLTTPLWELLWRSR